MESWRGLPDLAAKVFLRRTSARKDPVADDTEDPGFSLSSFSRCSFLPKLIVLIQHFGRNEIDFCADRLTHPSANGSNLSVADANDGSYVPQGSLAVFRRGMEACPY
jgi:hypothetical protein